MKKLLAKYRRVGIVVLVFLLLVLGIRNRLSAGKEKSIERYTVGRQTLQKTLTLSGSIEAEVTATLRFPISGKLVWVGVREGDEVKAYQTLASLDVRETQKKLERQLQSYLKTRWDFEQTADDYEGKILTDAIKRILEKSQFDLNTSVLDVEIQHLALELASLVSPIPGIVTRVTTPVAGVYISPTNAEFDVVDPASFYLSVHADQTEVTELTEGMEATITFDAFPSQRVSGIVKKISYIPSQNETGTVYEVFIAFPFDQSVRTQYRLGMTADVSFTVSEKPDVLAIPPEFLLEENGQPYVYKETAGKTQQTPVTAGEEYDTLQEILTGVSEGDVLRKK